MVATSAAQAVAKAKATRTCQPGMCLRYVRTWLDIAPKAPSAIKAWNAAKTKHTDRNPPAGAPVFYAGGKHGHITLSLGGGNVYRSTDCAVRGKVGSCTLLWPEQRWGHRYLGWSEDLNGVKIPYLSGGSSSRGTVYVSKLKKGTKDSDSVRALQQVLNGIKLAGGRELPVTGNYLDQTAAEVTKWQTQKDGAKAGTAAADGNLGPTQAKKLLAGSGYTVVDDSKNPVKG